VLINSLGITQDQGQNQKPRMTGAFLYNKLGWRPDASLSGRNPEGIVQQPSEETE